MKTFNEIVRYQIGEEGPQLPVEEYESRIDEILENMNLREFLEWRFQDALEIFLKQQ